MEDSPPPSAAAIAGTEKRNQLASMGLNSGGQCGFGHNPRVRTTFPGRLLVHTSWHLNPGPTSAPDPDPAGSVTVTLPVSYLVTVTAARARPCEFQRPLKPPTIPRRAAPASMCYE